MSGRYTDPVAVFDFASLYPSCMEQHNMCPSSRLTRARAALLGVAVTTPPAASLEGTWTRADGSSTNITDDWRTGAISLDGAQFRYETDINEAIAEAGGGRRAELFDGGYGLRWADGSEWARVPEEVLCFTERSVFTGIVPQLEADLKVERKAAKKRMAAAEEAGDVAGRAFMDNIQSSVKILMNGKYSSAEQSTRPALTPRHRRAPPPQACTGGSEPAGAPFSRRAPASPPPSPPPAGAGYAASRRGSSSSRGCAPAGSGASPRGGPRMPRACASSTGTPTRSSATCPG